MNPQQSDMNTGLFTADHTSNRSQHAVSSDRTGVARQQYPPLNERLAWRGQWSYPYEGPLTLLWKVVEANFLNPSQLCQILWGKSLLFNDLPRVHGRTFLSTAWMIPAKYELGKKIRAAGLDFISSRWANFLGSDSHIRYCRSCLSEGYQSIFCQIDGLLECPIHREPLCAACHACGEATGRYALTELTMSLPFKCPKCGAFYGDRPFSILVRNYSSLDESHFEPYNQIFTWFSEIASPRMSWPSFRDWQIGGDDALGQGEQRRAFFFVLTRLNPIAGMGSMAVHRMSIDVHVHRLRLGNAPSSGLLDSPDTRDEWIRRTHLYRALRRHVIRTLLRRHRRCLARALTRLTINWGSLEIYPTGEICPLAFAFFLWRHHLEEADVLEAPQGSLCLRTSILGWPGDDDVTTNAWGSFASMSFGACYQAAIEWCTEAAAMERLDEKEKEVRWRELVGMFRARLSPRILAWPSSVSYIRLADEGRREQMLAIVGRHIHSDRYELDRASWACSAVPNGRK